MAKQLPKKQEENTSEWMNTYADMVTLLLTFFVLLFASSNMDETKLQYIFQAFQVRGRYVNTVVTNPNEENTSGDNGNTNTPGDPGGEGEQPQSFDELYTYLSQYVEDQELGDSVTIEQGTATITIRFNDNVLFDGDSYMLKAEGKKIINGMVPGLKAVNSLLQELMVTGHTAYIPNPSINPQWLSVMRAVSVQTHLNLNEAVDESKYSCHGYGPNKPIAENDTAEGKRKNRRVELVLLRNTSDLDLNDPEVLRDILEHDFNIPNEKHNPLQPEVKDPSILPDGSAEKIIASIKDKFSNSGTVNGVYDPGTVDGNEFIIEEETKESSDK